MAKREASATWNGTLKQGNGVMRMDGWGEGAFSFKTRFEEGEDGTNPEQLIAAAHAGCFSMAFSAELEQAGIDSESVDTTAKVDLRPVDGAPTITKITLTTTANTPGADEAQVREAAEGAKKNCPVSRALGAVETIELDLTVNT